MQSKARYIYGPVNSRRLGRSLGVDIVPKKICPLDCVYCQVGDTSRKTMQRERFVSTAAVMRQLKAALKRHKRIDCITFSGSGEPTLNSDLGKMVREVKEISHLPVVVITDSSLLLKRSVRQELKAADLVMASLDAVTNSVFKRLNKPHSTLKSTDIVRGLKLFRREFKGRLWIEIMMVKGFNDSSSEVKKLAKAVKEIDPEKVQLNTVVRPPAKSFACPLSKVELKSIARLMGREVESLSARKGKRRRLGYISEDTSYENQ